MSLPKVTITFSNGNLLLAIDAIDGITAIVDTVYTVGLIGVPKQVFNLDDAIAQGFTEDDEPVMYRQIHEFYKELAGDQELWLMGTAETMTMAEALDHTDDDGAVKLMNAAEGKIRILFVGRKPDGGYDPGVAFYDADCEPAILAAKTFEEAELALLRPLRILVEGRVVNEDSLDRFEPKTAGVGQAGLIVGGSLNDGSASGGVLLGRAAKYGAEIKVGKVANGPLSITEAYIGTKLIKDVPGLAALHGSGVISFMKHPRKAGIYFGIDRMASIDDYRLLAYGRIVDKAAIIAAATYIEELEDEVTVEANGNISTLDIAHLEGRLTQQINVGMGDQISGVTVYINPAQDIINTSRLTVKLRVRPKGYKSFIDVDLGLTAPAISN